MREVYDLKDKLCKDLAEYGRKDNLSMSDLDVVDKLAHAIKNIGKVIEDYEEEYSDESYRGEAYEGDSSRGDSYRRGYYRGGGRSYGDGGYYGRDSYNDGTSYARGRNARRDSRGRYVSEGYSRNADDANEKLRRMMEEAPDEKTKEELQRMMTKLSEM